jgi:hypothetical protein
LIAIDNEFPPIESRISFSGLDMVWQRTTGFGRYQRRTTILQMEKIEVPVTQRADHPLDVDTG